MSLSGKILVGFSGSSKLSRYTRFVFLLISDKVSSTEEEVCEERIRALSSSGAFITFSRSRSESSGNQRICSSDGIEMPCTGLSEISSDVSSVEEIILFFRGDGGVPWRNSNRPSTRCNCPHAI